MSSNLIIRQFSKDIFVMLITRKIYKVLRNKLKQFALVSLLKQNTLVCFYNVQNFNPVKNAFLKTTLYSPDIKFTFLSSALLKKVLSKTKWALSTSYVNKLFFGNLLVVSFDQNSSESLIVAHKQVFDYLICDKKKIFPLFNYTLHKLFNFSYFCTYSLLKENVLLNLFAVLLCYHYHFFVFFAHLRNLIFLL
jgi:hypothetical protein